MLKRKSGIHSLKPLLISAQGIHWSHQRVLAVTSQIVMLIITIILLTNVAITLGERRLQEEWATQRYSELQTVATLIADKISFQQFRTQMFARGEILAQFLERPTRKQHQKLINNWSKLMEHSPELMGVALFDAKGRFSLATNLNFGTQSLPPSLLSTNRSMGGNEIYTSAVEFSPINGMLEPYIYQVAWLENSDQSVKGYLVTYNSMQKMLEAVKPAFANNQSPMLMLDTQGLLYAGARQANPLPRIPETMGGSLKQSYPALWRKMAMSNFGQFHGDDATFVYLKVELTTQHEAKREYYLVSYTLNDNIAAKFSQWHNILIATAVIVSLLAIGVMVLSHLFKLEQRSRHKSIELANGLFNSDMGCLISNDNGRVISANEKAARSLMLSPDELADRSLQRTLHLEDEAYDAIMQTLATKGDWKGKICLEAMGGTSLECHIRQAPGSLSGQEYYLVTFDDISDLVSCQQEAFLYQLLSDSAVATALTDANGHLLKVNPKFDTMMQLDGKLSHSLASLLENDLGNQWQRILQHISSQGLWQGQILCAQGVHSSGCLQATLKGQVDSHDELKYIVCTLEQASPRSKMEEVGDIMPHRSAILINLLDLDDYFKSLPRSSREHSSLILMDISPEGMLSHMSDIGQLESRQQEIEMQLLKELPSGYQITHWQLGKVIVILPDTNAANAHEFASQSLERLNNNGLGEGISIGIAAYQAEQNLEQFLSNAEIALQRAKQIGEQSICQAFTRQS